MFCLDKIWKNGFTGGMALRNSYFHKSFRLITIQRRTNYRIQKLASRSKRLYRKREYSVSCYFLIPQYRTEQSLAGVSVFPSWKDLILKGPVGLLNLFVYSCSWFRKWPRSNHTDVFWKTPVPNNFTNSRKNTHDGDTYYKSCKPAPYK